MEWTGGCLCGALRYRSASDPIWVSHCHCQMCRRHSGGVMGSFIGFPEGALEWSGAEPARYRSSGDVDRGFCPRCGSTLTFQREGKQADIALGTLDRAEALTPGGGERDGHIFVAAQLPWLKIDDGLPRHALRPGDADSGGD